MATAMKWDDVAEAIDMHGQGTLPLRAVAWAYRRWRRQDEQSGSDVTPDDLIREVGVSRTAAYRAIQEIGRYQPSRISGSDQPSRISGPGMRDESIDSPACRVPQCGTPPGPPYKEKRLDDGDEAVVENTEPFHPPAIIPTHPLPPGRISREAQALRAKFSGYGAADDGTSYGEIAAAMCDSTRADWVELYLEHQLAMWNRRPGFGACAQAMKRWRDAGKPGYRYTQQSTPEPLKATGTTGPAPRRPAPAEDDFSDLDDL